MVGEQRELLDSAKSDAELLGSDDKGQGLSVAGQVTGKNCVFDFYVYTGLAG